MNAHIALKQRGRADPVATKALPFAQIRSNAAPAPARVPNCDEPITMDERTEKIRNYLDFLGYNAGFFTKP